MASGTALALYENVVNGCLRKSVKVQRKNSSKSKAVTIKTDNIEVGLLTPEHRAAATVLAQTADEPDRQEDQLSAQTEVVTEHDEAASNAVAAAHEQSGIIRECLTALEEYFSRVSQREELLKSAFSYCPALLEFSIIE